MIERASDFIARALYDPQRGYYTRRIRDVGGGRGDFATSATLSPTLGRAIAQWLRAEMQAAPGVRDVIEVGAGNGALMQQIRRSIGWWQRARWQFHIVEKSPVLQERQRSLLGASVRWWDSIQTALHHCKGRALIYNNELMDAFPCTVAQWSATEAAWLEVWIETLPNGSAREVLKPLPWPAPEQQPFSALQQKSPPRDAQRIELHASVRDWLQGWSSHWQKGSSLIIDYGDEFPALYHRRPAGTLRGYLMHQRLTGPEVWQNPGRQDLTADINFTDLRHWTQDLGWQETTYTTQAEFIQTWNPQAHTAADQQMNAAGGAGDAFKCLTHRQS